MKIVSCCGINDVVVLDDETLNAYGITAKYLDSQNIHHKVLRVIDWLTEAWIHQNSKFALNSVFLGDFLENCGLKEIKHDDYIFESDAVIYAIPYDYEDLCGLWSDVLVKHGYNLDVRD